VQNNKKFVTMEIFEGMITVVKTVSDNLIEYQRDYRDQLTGIVSLVGSLQEQVASCREQVVNFERIIKDLQSENNTLKSQINETLTQNDSKTMCNESEANVDISGNLNRNSNLILIGVAESEEEADDDKSLKHAITELIDKTTGANHQILTAKRIGNQQKDRPRPIKIQFKTPHDRNRCFRLRRSFQSPCYLNEDLPKSIRISHGILRQKRAELSSIGISSNINWNDITITTCDSIFFLHEGRLTKINHESAKL
jgi:hypothetical protein